MIARWSPILAKALLDSVHSVIAVRSSSKWWKQFNVCQVFQHLDIWRKSWPYSLGHCKYNMYTCYTTTWQDMYVRQENEKVLRRSYLICHPAMLFIWNSAPMQCQICQVLCVHICLCNWIVHECCHVDLSCQGILQDQYCKIRLCDRWKPSGKEGSRCWLHFLLVMWIDKVRSISPSTKWRHHWIL